MPTPTPDEAAPGGRSPPPAAVGRLFRRARARHSLTQAALGRRLGLTKQQVCNVERGARWPSGKALWGVLTILGEV